MTQRSSTDAEPASTGDSALGRGLLAAALGLIGQPTLAFAFGQLWLLLGGRFSAPPAIAILALSLGLSLALAFRLARSWRVPASILAVIVLATAASAMVIDTSYDGQGYHYDAVKALALGWNPYRDSLRASDVVGVLGPAALWADYYPQGAWIASALEVAAGLPVEAAKDQALLALAALFSASLGVALSFGVDRARASVLALLVAANPVLLVQLFSRMNDGLLGACLALSAVFSVPWILRSDRWAAVGVVCPLLLALNLKFSALPLAAGLCALICLFALALRGWRTALRAAQTLGLAGLAGVLVLGAQPYVTNMVRHGHPLFPVMGEVRIDIMNNRPPPLEALSPPQRLAASYFGATSSGFWAPDTHLKPPFTLEKPELKAAGDYDTRLGGFGPFFSGALVLALILGAACGLQKARPPTVTRLLAGAAGLIALGLAMPEAWWARYVPHVWWAVVLVAVAGTVSRPRALRLGGGLLAAVLLVNAGLAAASSAWSIGQRNLDVRRQIAEIGRQSGPVCLYLGDFHARAELLGGLKQKIRMQSALPTHCDPVPLAGASTRHPVGYCPCP